MKFHFLSRKKPESLSCDGSERGRQNPEPTNHAGVTPLVGSEQVTSPFQGVPLKQIDANAEGIVESRAELVARLRQEIRDGTYEIPVSQLVKALTALLLRRR